MYSQLKTIIRKMVEEEISTFEQKFTYKLFVELVSWLKSRSIITSVDSKYLSQIYTIHDDLAAGKPQDKDLYQICNKFINTILCRYTQSSGLTYTQIVTDLNVISQFLWSKETEYITKGLDSTNTIKILSELSKSCHLELEQIETEFTAIETENSIKPNKSILKRKVKLKDKKILDKSTEEAYDSFETKLHKLTNILDDVSTAASRALEIFNEQ